MSVFDYACNCWNDGVWACGFGVVGSGGWFRSADACSDGFGKGKGAYCNSRVDN